MDIIIDFTEHNAALDLDRVLVPGTRFEPAVTVRDEIRLAFLGEINDSPVLTKYGFIGNEHCIRLPRSSDAEQRRLIAAQHALRTALTLLSIDELSGVLARMIEERARG